MSKTISKPKKRIAYIDIAKGIAMLSIIAGHFGIASADRIVYTFHVPLFFLLSGYFLSTKLDLIPFAKQKAKQLLVPYYFTGGLIIVFATVINSFLVDNYDAAANALSIFKALVYAAGTPHTSPIIIRQIGLLWFLWALFFGLIITRFALEKKHPLVIVSLTALAGWGSSLFFWLPLSVQSGCIASFFLYLGYCAKQRNILDKKPPLIVVISLIALWAICIHGNIYINIVSGTLMYGPISVIDSIGASYLIVLICKKLEEIGGGVPKFLNFFGQSTLIIMCFHAISDFTFPNWMVWDVLGSVGIPHYIGSVAVITLNVIWPLIGVFIVKHVPPLQKIFSYREPSPLDKMPKI